ncbi:cardiolipin synthase A [Oceaniferula spumae]|uniref:Cardiolipin synthase n=1 Tax=Oceaniferula spumae TaxID=2979115 RepID=A0AAT9FNH0_9BACT
MNPNVISTIFVCLHWLVVVGLSVRVIMRRAPVGVSLAWLVVISTTPGIGAFLYLLVGEKRLGKHRAAYMSASLKGISSWLHTLRKQEDAVKAPIDEQSEPMRLHAQQMLGIPALKGNSVEILSDFQTIFDSLIADIDAAQNSCHLGFYIWHEGGRVNDVVDALARAAARGVECLALADAIGSKSFLNSSQAKKLRSAGVTLTAALPTGFIRNMIVRRDLRNHRKVVVIDDAIAYTGSQNLADPRIFKTDSGVGAWVDAMVRIQGPIIAEFAGVFSFDWSLENGTSFEAPKPTEQITKHGNITAQVIPSGPGLRPEAIHQLFLTAIYSARRELIITTPYFVPEESILTALLSAATRGVEVTLIVPAKNDSLLVRFAGVAYFDDLMSAGVRIALFEGGLLHTKSITIDGSVSLFGSVNLDIRSLWLNFEISLFIYDAEFTNKLLQLQREYLNQSTMLDLEEWRQRPTLHRFTEDAFRLLGPLL